MLKHKKVTALLCAGSMFLGGCGEELAPEAPTEGLRSVEQGSICGPTTDWSDVEPWAYNRGGDWGDYILRSQRAAGMIRRRSDGKGWCTGYLIAENLVLTAGHCFIDTADATNYDVVFDYQVDTAGTPRTPQTFQIAQGLERFDTGGVDFAVVRLTDNAGHTFGSLPLSNALPTANQSLTIIQHPAGLLKKHHDGNYSGRLSDGQLTYGNIDTVGGSSGSPVIGYKTVLGVHTGGACGPTSGFNAATSMPDVFANSTVIPSLVSFQAGGNLTSLGRITLSTATQSCTRSGDFDDMMNGCALRLNAGDVVTVSCTTNNQYERWIADFFASGATLNFTSWTGTSATATFTYTGTGVKVYCNFTD